MVRFSRRSILTKLANAQCKVTSGMPSPHTNSLTKYTFMCAGICGAKPDHPHADMLVCMKTSSVGSASHLIAQLYMMLSPLRATLTCKWSGLVALRRVRFPPGSPFTRWWLGATSSTWISGAHGRQMSSRWLLCHVVLCTPLAPHFTHTTRALSLELGMSGVAGFFCVMCAPSRPDSHLAGRVLFLR